jgi:DNA polymerase-3 subunit delta'
MAFASVLGHDQVKELLERALRGGRLPPALLLAGPEGVGKRTLALQAALASICEGDNFDACGSCSSCRRTQRTLEALPELRRKIEDEREPTLRNFRLHPDLLLAEPWKTGLKVDQVRQLVQELQGSPFEGRGRAVVIDDAHLMNEQAQNALLKSLEEPPATSHVFLVTSAPQALLPTIRSRCQLLRLGPLPQGLLAAHLEERLGLTPEEARLRAALANGSLGTALAFESDAYRGRRERLLGLLESLPTLGPVERMEAADELGNKEEGDPEGSLLTLRALLRDVAALRRAPSLVPLNADVTDRLLALSRGPLGERAPRLAESVAETREALARNANRPLAFDLLLDVLAS